MKSVRWLFSLVFAVESMTHVLKLTLPNKELFIFRSNECFLQVPMLGGGLHLKEEHAPLVPQAAAFEARVHRLLPALVSTCKLKSRCWHLPKQKSPKPPNLNFFLHQKIVLGAVMRFSLMLTVCVRKRKTWGFQLKYTGKHYFAFRPGLALCYFVEVVRPDLGG